MFYTTEFRGSLWPSTVVVTAPNQHNSGLSVSPGDWFGLFGVEYLPILKKTIQRISSCSFTRRDLSWRPVALASWEPRGDESEACVHCHPQMSWAPTICQVLRGDCKRYRWGQGSRTAVTSLQDPAWVAPEIPSECVDTDWPDFPQGMLPGK